MLATQKDVLVVAWEIVMVPDVVLGRRVGEEIPPAGPSRVNVRTPSTAPQGFRVRPPWRIDWVMAAALVAGLAWSAVVLATPPCNESYQRTQEIDHQGVEADILRVWMVFVDQGDGILIQLPERFSAPGSDGEKEPVEVLIDSGSSWAPDRMRMARFLSDLLPGEHRIEHVVLTHHDEDHVSALATSLESGRFTLGTVYHNGLVSYRPNEIRADGAYAKVVAARNTKNEVSREMAYADTENRLRGADLIGDRETLEAMWQQERLEGVYEELAGTIVSRGADAFQRVGVKAGDGPDPFVPAPFIQVESPADATELKFELLWPPIPARRFTDWSHTINGNSVVFRLVYGDFAMLFTGDLNRASENLLVESLGDEARRRLESDVLKVPHHGSKDYDKGFIDHVSPMISVASMGRRGFGTSWKHPSKELVEDLGGPNHVFHTFSHETAIDWPALKAITNGEKRREEIAQLTERAHILIETDGRYFRVVEISAPDAPTDPSGISEISGVPGTRRGDGTRWITALAGGGHNCD